MAATRATEGEFLNHKQSVGGAFGGCSAPDSLSLLHNGRMSVCTNITLPDTSQQTLNLAFTTFIPATSYKT
jgi:hypothetical protein